MNDYVIAMHHLRASHREIRRRTGLSLPDIGEILHAYRKAHPQTRIRVLVDDWDAYPHGTVLDLDSGFASAWIEGGWAEAVMPVDASCGLPRETAVNADLHADSARARDILAAYYHWPTILYDAQGVALGFDAGNPTRSRHTSRRKANGKIDRDFMRVEESHAA